MQQRCCEPAGGPAWVGSRGACSRSPFSQAVGLKRVRSDKGLEQGNGTFHHARQSALFPSARE